ncbi:O-antigen polymerase [Providencia hangzhouensis]|uniref:O-antigen polymerase n=1 Tax=Providencia hangzhouensis TaxID=3031799 RepID=UPI0034DCDF75
MNLSKYLVIILSSIFFWGALSTTYILDFKYPLPFEILASSILDWFLTTLVFIIIMHIYKKRVESLNNFFSINVRKSLERKKHYLYIIVLIAFLYFYFRLNLILDGATREQLVFDEDSSRFMMLASPFFVVMCAISISYQYNFKIIIACLLGVFLVSAYNLSRSEFANLISLIILCLSLKGLSFKVILKLIIFSILFVIIAGILTIYQGRADTINSSITGILNAFFKYKAFSFYLAELSIEKISNDIEQILYPFFGFFIERFLIIIEPISNPISVYDADFISEFHRLGPNNTYDGNVLYPWWSWFYGAFGIFGILIKSIFTLIVLIFLLKSKFRFLTLYTLYLILFVSYFRHPILNVASAYAIILFLIMDLLIILSEKKECIYRNNR